MLLKIVGKFITAFSQIIECFMKYLKVLKNDAIFSIIPLLVSDSSVNSRGTHRGPTTGITIGITTGNNRSKNDPIYSTCKPKTLNS